MTHDILPADVDLANKLRSAGHSDEDVITAMVHRGIDRGEATQLVDDLRNGRHVKTKIQKGLENSPRRRRREHRSDAPHEMEASSEPAERPVAPQPRKASRHEESKKRSPKKKGFRFWPWMILALICAGGAGIGLIVFNHGGSWSKRFTTAAAREVQGDSDSALDTVSARESNLAPDELALDFGPGGLHLRGILVTRENATKVFTDLLGAPTRSLSGKQPGTVNYAFDRYGLVICSHLDGVNDSILVDCDGVGGATGTTTGFKGLLRVEDGDVIRTATASKTLAGIKRLGFDQSGLASGVLDGRYQDLHLVFVYLKSPNRMSAVEIDFK